MIAQLEFQEIIDRLPPAPPARLHLRRKGLNLANYAIGLSAAINSYQVSHPLFALLTAVARDQVRHGHAIKPSLAAALGVTFNAVSQHLLKFPDLFHQESPAHDHSPGRTLARVTLTAEAATLLRDINRRAKRYAEANLS